MRLMLRPEEGGGSIGEEHPHPDRPDGEGREGQHQPDEAAMLREQEAAAHLLAPGFDAERDQSRQGHEGEQDHAPAVSRGQRIAEPDEAGASQRLD